MVFLRKPLLYFFIAVYVVLCPAVILYTLGFVFKPSSKSGFIRTGLIYLSSLPISAAVYFEDVLYPKKTPTAITGLQPGQYRVKLSLEGYLPWETRVYVRTRRATVVSPVILVPEEWEKRWYTDGPVDRLIGLSGRGSVLLAGGSSVANLSLFDLNSKSIRPLVDPESPLRNAELISAERLEGIPAVLIRARLRGSRRSFFVRADDQGKSVEDVTRFVGPGGHVETVCTDGGGRLFVLRGGDVDVLDLKSGAETRGFARNVQGMGVAGTDVYLLTNEGDLIKTGYERAERRVLLKGVVLAGEGVVYRIELFTNSLLVLFGSDGRLVVLDRLGPFEMSQARGYTIDVRSRRFLVWREDSIGILDLKIPAVGGGAERGNGANAGTRTRERNGDEGLRFRWVHTGGRNIEQVFWVYGDSYVSFRDRDETFLLGPVNADRSRLSRLVAVKNGSEALYREEDKTLYFVDPDTSRLGGIEVVSRMEIFDQFFSNLLRGY